MTLWRFALGLAALVTISRGHVLVPNVQCGTPDPTDELIMVAQQAARNESLLTGAGLTPKDVINVPMYIHVVSSSKDNFTKVSQFPCTRSCPISSPMDTSPDYKARKKLLSKVSK